MRLIIAERSPILRKRLTRLVSDLGFISLVALVQDLAEVQKIAAELKPDVIVIDIDFPNHSDLDMLGVLKAEMKTPGILLLTETTEPRHIGQFLNAGVDMVFNKKDDLNGFIAQLNFMGESMENLLCSTV